MSRASGVKEKEKMQVVEDEAATLA